MNVYVTGCRLRFLRRVDQIGWSRIELGDEGSATILSLPHDVTGGGGGRNVTADQA